MATIEISEERGVRYLHFGSPWVQGAMRIARPWSLELEYTREMMVPLVLRADAAWPASVLQVGLGSASLTRFLHHHRPDAKLTVIEIAPAVVAAARQFFKLPEESPRLRIEIADGHDYMAATRRRFDLVLVDAFDDKGRSGMLDSIPFYLNCRARLADGGMAAVNFLDRRKGAKAGIERMRTAFDDRVLVLPPCEAGNTVAIATTGAPLRESFDDLRAAAAKVREGTGLNLLPTLARLTEARGGKALLL
jgi:spermidine synthase